MREAMLDILVDPIERTPLRLRVASTESNGEVLEGELESGTGRRYPISRAIPRFVLTQDADQAQTRRYPRTPVTRATRSP
jgi:uncharacterized protein YbaR (Trm112 family)